MATNFPTSGDDGTTLPNPNGTDKTNSPDHASLHGNANDAIKAIEAKIGTGSSTPTNNTILRGTGVGTSTWSTLTSAQLLAILTDETGTGSAVFATTATLVTPKIDTINESTPGNGTTIGGVNIRSGALNTNNSVVTANITDGAVTPAKLQASTGSTWVWQSWTPALVSISGGTQTFAKYIQVGKTVHFRFMYTLAGAGVGTNPSFSLPVAMNATYAVTAVDGVMGFLASYNDSSANTVSPLLTFIPASSTTTVRLLAPTAGGTYIGVANLTATVPITWATGDYIFACGTYETA